MAGRASLVFLAVVVLAAGCQRSSGAAPAGGAPGACDAARLAAVLPPAKADAGATAAALGGACTLPATVAGLLATLTTPAGRQRMAAFGKALGAARDALERACPGASELLASWAGEPDPKAFAAALTTKCALVDKGLGSAAELSATDAPALLVALVMFDWLKSAEVKEARTLVRRLVDLP